MGATANALAAAQQLQITEIPLLSVPQTLTVTLLGIDYDLTIIWNDFCGAWTMTIALSSTGVVLASSIPLLTGVDILGQYQYLGIAGILIVQTDNDTLADPTFTNLGQTAHLYFIPDPQVSA